MWTSLKDIDSTFVQIKVKVFKFIGDLSVILANLVPYYSENH